MITEKKIKAMIEAYGMINEGDSILVALSGGSDSCALLFYLVTQYSKNKIKIYAAHLNHMIRDKDADRDEKFVKNLCAEYNIRLFTERLNIPEIAAQTKKTLEEAARDERYAFFERVCEEINKTEAGNIKIATAHNASDNTETVIFNISRGCGSDGLCGIAPVLGNIIRPMLSCTKEEILKYCEKNNIGYVEDKTNSDEVYTRNFIRHSVAKTLKSRFFKLDENIYKMTEIVRADMDFIDNYVREVMRENNITDSADIDFLLNMDKAVSSRIIKKMYDNATGRISGGLEYKHLLYIQETVNKKENKSINLPQNIIAQVLYGRLIFKQIHGWQMRNLSLQYNQALETGINNIAGTNISVCIEYIDYAEKTPKVIKIEKSSENVYNLFNHAYIDFDKIIGRIYMRNRHINDEYIFFGQTKSVKKNYINYKVPAEIRDILPVLYDDRGIVWACGLPVSDRVKVTGETKKIMSIKVSQER